jgi:hypothetical protein
MNVSVLEGACKQVKQITYLRQLCEMVCSSSRDLALAQSSIDQPLIA